ncbi:MAG: hypothetical protein NC078_02940 [Ruminococcus sp.]|nr:hypothetical protein [Ruminococcus sp.]
MSRDDDFCSHCGAAVYPDNNFTGSDIGCGTYGEFDGGGEHSHEKVTYTKPYANSMPSGGTYDRPPMQSRPAERPPVEGGRKKGGGCVTFIVILVIFFTFVDSMGIDIWGILGELLEQILNG